MNKEIYNTKIKRINDQKINNYESIFLKKIQFKNRKSIYISQNMHKQIVDIAWTISSGEMSIGAYIENVMNYHFETHKEEINALIDKINLRFLTSRSL